MKSAIVMCYENSRPKVGKDAKLEPWAAAIGHLEVGERLTLLRYATIRADGEHISIGDDCWFAERATVHIADSERGTVIANRVSVGRFAVVHACTVCDDCVIGDSAVVMDGAILGPGLVIAAGALVPPRKKLESGWIYAGAPVEPVRRIEESELRLLRQQLVERTPGAIVCLENVPYVNVGHLFNNSTEETRHCGYGNSYPEVSEETFIAPTAVLTGRVILNDFASVWFGTVLDASSSEICVGKRTNIQDNCLIDSSNGPVVVGDDVTFGHNVCLSSARVDDGALIGMGAAIGEGSVVESGACVAACARVDPGTVIRAGYLWAGRPAHEVRPMRSEEREYFRKGNAAYIRYLNAYGKGASP